MSPLDSNARLSGWLQSAKRFLARDRVDVAARSDDSSRLATGSLRMIRGMRRHVADRDSIESLSAALLDRLERDAGEPTQSTGVLLGSLHARLALLTDNTINRFARSNNRLALRQLRECPGFRDELLQGATCVEFGCGSLNPLGGLLPLLALGAQRIVGVDHDAIDDARVAARAMYEAAADMIVDPASYFGNQTPFDPATIRTNLMRLDLAALRTGAFAELPADHAEFLRQPAEATSLATASTDFTFSISFLEHVRDPEAVIRELARISAPGALGAHRIDGSDHMTYADDSVHPLQFLMEQPGAEMVRWSNRIRPLDYAPLFERHGFELLLVQPKRTVEVDDALLARLVEPYRNMPRESLAVIGATLFVRRI